MRLRLNDQAVLYIEFMVEQHPEKHSSFLPFLCQRYAITGALQLSTTFLQLLKREGRHKRTRDEWKKFHEPRIVQALKPYRAAWSRMKGAEFCSRRWSPSTKKHWFYAFYQPRLADLTPHWHQTCAEKALQKSRELSSYGDGSLLFSPVVHFYI